MIDVTLLQDFISETEEHLDELEHFLMELEANPEDRDLLNDIFRSIHTVKGSSEFVGVARVAELTHRVENLLESIRHGQRIISRDIIEFLFEVRDRINSLVDDLNRCRQEETEIDDLLAQIDILAQGKTSPPATQEMEHLKQPNDDLLDDLVDDHSPNTGQGTKTSAAAFDHDGQTISVSNAMADQEDDDGEVYAEDYDTELFDIFIDNMRENFSALSTLVSDTSDTEDLSEIVVRYGQSVQNLRSSANYMGYERLTRLYDRWLIDIESLDPHTPSLLANLQTCTNDYITKAARFFPTVKDLQEAFGGKQRPEYEMAAPPDSRPDKPSAARTDSNPQDEGVEQAPSETDNYDKLGRAFDSAMQLYRNEDMASRPSEMEKSLFSGADPQTGLSGVSADYVLDMSALTSGSNTPPSEDVDAETLLFSGVNEVNDGTAGQDGSEVAGDEKPVGADPIADGSDEDGRTPGTAGENPEGKAVKMSIRVEAQKIDSLMNQVGELVVSRAWFSQLFSEMRGFERLLRKNYDLEKDEIKQVRNLTFRLSEATVALGRVANELQEGVMKIRMMPIAQLFNRYPRLVRELSRETGKSVQLEIRGEETELDKMIIEEISDPLIHIIRNAVDHGIESSEERLRNGKPADGGLVLEAFHESNHVVIEIRDDGRGIDPERVKAVALAKELHLPDELERMPAKDMLDMIMKPGFSTAERVTHTSGRGMGMDVVRKNIEKLNGSVEVESTPGIGTCIRIKIPLTLAIIPALLVRVGSEMYTVPLAAVEETLRIDEHQTSYLEGIEVIYLRQSTLPLIRLSEVFNLNSVGKDPERAFVVVVNTGVRQVGLVVDELIGQEEVVIKPLVDYLQDKSGFSGATILGDGEISLILDVSELVQLSVAKKARRVDDPQAFVTAFDAVVQQSARVEATV